MLNLRGVAPLPSVQYQPGVCNIGPAEIARRRNFGHLGLFVSVVLFAGLILVGAPHLTRLLLILTAGGAASGYLQARFHFCAGFGSKGVFNFGPVGDMMPVTDPSDLARDRAMSMRIGLASLAIGVLVAVVAVLLPF
jgi:hypothetical protein